MAIEIKLSDEDKLDIINGVAKAILNKEAKEILIVYSVEETAKALKLTPQTINRYIKKGLLKAHRVGKSAFITETNLKNFINGK